MPPKIVVSTTLISLGNDVSIAEILEADLQIVTIGQLKGIVEQINIG